MIVGAPSTGADISTPNLTSVKIIKTGTHKPMRARAAQTNKITLCFKPMMSFLQYSKWIPLMLIKQGLQLIFELENPSLAINTGLKPSLATTAPTYTISSPRYVANMVTPDDSLLAAYLNEFQGDGIHIPIMGYRHRRQTITSDSSGATVINHHFGVRSAVSAFTVIQPQILAESDGEVARANNSISTFIKSGVKRYQYKSGSEEYPQKAVEWTDSHGLEAFQHLMLATNQFSSTLFNVRFSPKEWREDNTIYSTVADAVATNQSTKFIMAANLSRNDDNFTGLDLSVNPLDLEINFDADNDWAATSRIVNTFVSHDILVTISSSGLVVRG
jgi:hypothetical protein